MKKTVATILLSVVMLAAASSSLGSVFAQDILIVIHADGTVEGTSLIQRNGDLYTLTSDIQGCLTIEKNSVVLDGRGFALTGAGALTLTDVSNITITNLSIQTLETGVMIERVSSLNMRNMHIVAERAGIRARNLTDSTLSESYIEAKVEYGLALGFSPNNKITNNTIVSSMIDAVDCSNSANTLISGNNITYKPSEFPLAAGIQTNDSPNVTISENTITRFPSYGLELLWDSDNTHIEANVIMYCNGGMRINSNGNTLTNNLVAGNTGAGISLDSATGNTLRDNRLANNSQNLQIGSYSPSGWVNDVDTSNWVELKPVYYWVNEVGKVVPQNAGYIALVNCTSITVQDQEFSHAGDCIVLAYTANSTIQGNLIADNSTMRLYFSSENKFLVNTFEGNHEVLSIFSSSFNNIISGNNFTRNRCAVSLSESSSNTLTQNNFVDNEEALYFQGSSSNNIFLNNFQGNTRDVADAGMSDPYSSVATAKDGSASGASLKLASARSRQLNFVGPPPLSANNWDNGAKGNYWSNYNGTDSNGDDIGDTPLYLYGNNQDNYPLMAPANITMVLEPVSTPQQTPSPTPSASPSPTCSVPELSLPMALGLLAVAMLVAVTTKKRKKAQPAFSP